MTRAFFVLIRPKFLDKTSTVQALHCFDLPLTRPWTNLHDRVPPLPIAHLTLLVACCSLSFFSFFLSSFRSFFFGRMTAVPWQKQQTWSTRSAVSAMAQPVPLSLFVTEIDPDLMLSHPTCIWTTTIHI